MHFKRTKSRRQIRCSCCTPVRWRGNNQGRFKIKDTAKMRESPEEIGPHEFDPAEIENDWEMADA